MPIVMLKLPNAKRIGRTFKEAWCVFDCSGTGLRNQRGTMESDRMDMRVVGSVEARVRGIWF